LKLNGKHQILAYADDVNTLGDNTDTVKKSSGTLGDESDEVGLAVNVEKTEYILMSCHQHADQIRGGGGIGRQFF
jgi:hypothetical protein